MALTDRDKHILDVLSQYTFLDYCQKQGLISKEKRQEIIFSFGSAGHEIIDYYVTRLEGYYKDTSRFLDKLKGI